MKNFFAVTAAACLAAALTVGCSHGQCSMCSSNSAKPVEGNPGATTAPSAGYDTSDPNHYHPLTDDTKQYRPAPANAVQPSTQP